MLPTLATPPRVYEIQIRTIEVALVWMVLSFLWMVLSTLTLAYLTLAYFNNLHHILLIFFLGWAPLTIVWWTASYKPSADAKPSVATSGPLSSHDTRNVISRVLATGEIRVPTDERAEGRTKRDVADRKTEKKRAARGEDVQFDVADIQERVRSALGVRSMTVLSPHHSRQRKSAQRLLQWIQGSARVPAVSHPASHGA